MTDYSLERIVGNLLRTGVILAAAVVAAGGIWYLLDYGSGTPHYQRFQPDVQKITSVGSLPRPELVILVGLLILIATPIARVMFSLVAFALERDRLYVVFTLIVLLVLLYSIGTSWL
jgi:uncharacterized membrane protein